MFPPPPFVPWRLVLDFREGGHEGGIVPEPVGGFVRINPLHITFLCVLTEFTTLCPFEQRALEGSIVITLLPGVRVNAACTSAESQWKIQIPSIERVAGVPAIASATFQVIVKM